MLVHRFCGFKEKRDSALFVVLVFLACRVLFVVPGAVSHVELLEYFYIPVYENKYSLSNDSTAEEAKYISCLHDIDLQSDEKSANSSYLLLTSSGLSAETKGGQLGIYKEAGTYNNSPFYRQLDSVRSDREHLLYRHRSGHWVVVRSRGNHRVSKVGLWSRIRSDSVPLTGWCFYVGSQYRVDPQLRISPVIPMACYRS